MIRPSLHEMEALAKEYTRIPICMELYADVITPIALLRKFSKVSDKYFLLESVEGGETWGRYSFLGFDPTAQVTCNSGSVTITENDSTRRFDGDPYDILRRFLQDYKAPKFDYLPPFTGGMVGYFAYEMIDYAERKLCFEGNDFNDYDLLLFEHVIAYDHLKQKLFIIINIRTDDLKNNYDIAVRQIKRIVNIIQEPLYEQETEARKEIEFTCELSKEAFCKMVEQTRHYIQSGDIFQAVISRTFKTEYKESLMNAYRVLRTTNPSPYMVYLCNGEVELMASSPETLVRLSKGRVITFPIAGSRPRGRDEQEDMAMEKELISDEKELSEHNMLVDLARNDIGKVSKMNSVCVTKYMEIQKFSKIMHLTSVVEGELEKGMDSLDALKAILPAGTLSGAPKIRACEIIHELEQDTRGIYGGAIGYIDFNGTMDTCIAIRMAIKKKDVVYVRAGAGIVADSVPEREYEETLNKAKAVMEAIHNAWEVEHYDYNH